MAAHELCYLASPQLPLKDLPLPRSSSEDDVPWRAGQVPGRAAAQSFAVFGENAGVWDL